MGSGTSSASSWGSEAFSATVFWDELLREAVDAFGCSIVGDWVGLSCDDPAAFG
jgi:hypothetical protein